ncbi:hypothetical protein [Mycobacterium sp. 155]|uniref:hypothetical protein n=1 Tax=Mycobacterium sp. 155 TaxID=1157943 RepID=UPI001E38EDA9|nr:hypothetical protein [Mycobacterium sp. 155]
MDELTLDPAAQVPCFAAAVPGKYLLHNFSTGGMVMRWYRDQFCGAERQIEDLCDINAYYLIHREVQSVAAGCDGLVVLPHLQGSGPARLRSVRQGDGLRLDARAHEAALVAGHHGGGHHGPASHDRFDQAAGC